MIDLHDGIVTAGGVELPVKSLTVTVDESWSPYVQVTECTVALTDPSILDVLDPRKLARARLELRREFAAPFPNADLTDAVRRSTPPTRNADLTAAWGGLTGAQITDRFTSAFNPTGMRAPQVRRMNLAVQEARVNHRTAEVSVRLASDETLLQGHKLVQAGPYTNAGTSLRDLVQTVLARIGGRLAPGTWDAPLVAQGTEWLPGRSAWDYLAPHIEKAGGRLWCDEGRVWRLSDREPLAPGQLTLTTGEYGSLVDAEDTISRTEDDGWADAVVVTYRWTDAAGASMTAYDVAGDPLAQKVVSVERDTPFPGVGAAAALLKRAQGRGRVLALAAVSDYTAQPGQPTRVELPNTPTQTGLVSSVTWRLPAAQMSIRTRGLIDTPETAWAFVEGGKRWQDVPAGTDWTEYVNG